MTSKSLSLEIFDKFYSCHWFVSAFSCRNFPKLLKEAGVHKPIFAATMEKDVNAMMFQSEQFEQAATYYANKLVHDHVWRKKMYVKHDALMKKYFAASEKFCTLPFSQLSDKQMFREVSKIMSLHEKIRIIGVTLNGLVIDGRGHLSNALKQELKPFVKEKEFEMVWSTLTQVTKLSLRQQKDEALLQLALKIRTKKNFQYTKHLQKIYQKFCWLDYMYYGPSHTFEDFETELQNLVHSKSPESLKTKMSCLKKEQRTLMKKFNFSAHARRIVVLAQNILFQKGWRKDVEYHGFNCYEPFFRELAKRKGERDWKNLLYLLPWEMQDFLFTNKPFLSQLHDRREFSLFTASTEKCTLVSGTKAQKFFEKLYTKEVNKKEQSVTGQCAFAGKVQGTVKIVLVRDDIKKMNTGDVLVSQATSPDLIEAMKKASAIVTNVGGLICHAAITSRELKIPCVVGTQNATTVFQDGDMVEVDATKGVIKKLNI